MSGSPRRSRRLAAAAVLVLSLVVLGAAAPARSAPSPSPSAPKPRANDGVTAGDLGDLVVLSGDVVLPKGETSGDIVLIHGTAAVAGVVRGDLVVVDGPVTVSGIVRGDLVALDGDVALLTGAHVTGDVVVAHGKLTIQVGALIDGNVKRGGFSFLSPSRLVTKLAFWIAISVSTLLLGLALVLVAPRGAEAVARAGRNAVGASVGWGAAAVFGLPVAAVLLLVTLVGAPFGLGLLFGLALLYSVGYAYAAVIVGRLFIHPARGGGSRRVLSFVGGWVVLRAIGFVPVVGGITWFLAAWFGLGAAIVAVWRARQPPVPRLPERPDPGFASAATTVPPPETVEGDAADVLPAPPEPPVAPVPDAPPYSEPAH